MNTTCTHPTAYPIDMSDTEWDLIAPYVAPDPKIGSPRDVCMRCVVNALTRVRMLAPAETPTGKAELKLELFSFESSPLSQSVTRFEPSASCARSAS